MSLTYDGHETFIRFAKQAAIGTAGTTWHLWDTGEADSLSFNEEPDDRGVLHGARGKRRYAKRRGMQSPAGDLPAYPWNQDGTSTALKLILESFFQEHSSAVVSTGTAGTVYRMTWTIGSQQDGDDLQYLTFQKDTAIDGSGEQYLDALMNSLTISRGAGEHTQISGNVKSRTATFAASISGTGDPITAAFVRAPNITSSWNGNTVYPNAMSVNMDNNLPDRYSGNSRGRTAFHLGPFSGEASLDFWRDENSSAYFRADYGSADPTGTYIEIWTLPTGYGTHEGGVTVSGTMILYIAPNWLDMPAQEGDLIDTFSGDLLQDSSISITTEISSV